jgi:hypothetical protein
MATWVTADEAAAQLGIPAPDDRLDVALAAVVAEVERIRTDLDFETPDVPAQVKQGALLWTAEIWTVQNAPSGFPQWDASGGDVYGPIQPSRWSTIARFIGIRRPVAL